MVEQESIKGYQRPFFRLNALTKVEGYRHVVRQLLGPWSWMGLADLELEKRIAKLLLQGFLWFFNDHKLSCLLHDHQKKAAYFTIRWLTISIFKVYFFDATSWCYQQKPWELFQGPSCASQGTCRRFRWRGPRQQDQSRLDWKEKLHVEKIWTKYRKRQQKRSKKNFFLEICLTCFRPTLRNSFRFIYSCHIILTYSLNLEAKRGRPMTNSHASLTCPKPITLVSSQSQTIEKKKTSSVFILPATVSHASLSARNWAKYSSCKELWTPNRPKSSKIWVSMGSKKRHQTNSSCAASCCGFRIKSLFCE